MARSTNQKLKLLHLLRYLMRQSDENHPVSVADMIAELARHDIAAERKSIYDDLEALRSFGVDIVQQRGKAVGYYIGQREFELPELKLLVDSIQSSKFITEKKTVSLIRKVENLANVYDARMLERQVYVRNRVKSMNESVYYNVDEISNAISQDRMIRYRYFEFTVEKQRQFRRGGAYYVLSPFALMWDDENYYLVAYDSEAGRIKHYRVDKMTNISVIDEARDGLEAYNALDMGVYARKVFVMFSGSEEKVTMRFSEHLVGAVLDRLGQEVMIVPDGEGWFTVTAEVVVSPIFFAWMCAFGAEARITAPERVVTAMRDHVASVSKMYD